MITILVDHNIEGQAVLLWGTLGAGGWLGVIEMRMVRFDDVGLAPDSSDREVWHFAQRQQMLLLTDNRNMDGADSLEATIRDENSATSLPVLTIGRADRIPDKGYRERCALRLLDIVMDLKNYLGVGRIFIP
jgi:hypothetical protein